MSVPHLSEPEGASGLKVAEAGPKPLRPALLPASKALPARDGLSSWLPERWRKPVVGYAAAVLLQVLAVLLTWVLVQAFPSFNFPATLSLLAVAVIALTWGAGPSFLALLLGAVLIDYFLLSPRFSLYVERDNLVGLVVFLLVGLLISRLASLNKRTRSAAEALAGSLESEGARLQAIFEAIPDPITFYDAQGTLISANPAGLRDIGERPLPAALATLPGVYDIRTAQGDPLSAEQLPVARALRGETVDGIEVFSRGADGQDRILLTGAAPIRNWQGQIMGAVATSHDVTALRQAENEAAQQRRQLQGLQALTDTALTHLSLNNLLRELLNRLREVIGADNAAILLLDEEGQMLHMRAAHGLEEEVAENVHIPVGVGFAGRIAARRQPLIVEDLSTFDAFNPFLKEKLRSVVGVPLMVEERVLGVAHVGTAGPRHFTDEEVQLLQRAADRIALAVDRAAIYTTAQAARSEAEQRASELESVIAAITDGVSIYGPEGETRSINTAARAMMGFDAQPGVEALSLEEHVPLVEAYDDQGNRMTPEQFPAFRVVHGETLDSANSVDMHLRALDGREVHLNCTGAPIRDANGRQIGAVLVARNVTERRQLERQASERAGQLEAMFNSMTDGLVVFDAQGNLLQMNAAARSLLSVERPVGYSLERASPGSSRFLVRDEKGRPLMQQQWPISRILQGETLTAENAVDLLMRSLDGREVQVSVSGAPVRDEQGAIVGAVSVIHDVTERRRLERRTQESLQALLDMAQALVEEAVEAAPTEQNGVALDVVARRLAELACRVIGGQRTAFYIFDAETKLLRPLAVVGLSPEQEQEWSANPAPARRLGENLTPELTERFLAGEVITVDMRQPPLNALPNRYHVQTLLAAPLNIGQRLVGQFVLDFGPEAHDFTPQEIALAGAVGRLAALVIDRDRLLHEREEARASVLALREANRRMDEFLGIASHELRTPLTKIKTSMQLAEHRARTAVRQDSAAGNPLAKTLQPIQEMIGRGVRSVDVVNRLVGDLLDVSRIQADRLEMRLAPIDLTQVVREVVEEQRELFPNRAITLTAPERDAHAALPEGPPPILVLADADRVAQVVINYLTNALKYSPVARPVEVGVQLDEHAARVWVRDHGPGIPPAAQEHLWERFYQVQGVTVQQGSSVGLGLGLYISKTIIERHGGQVGVESVPGEGATFWFTLPAAE